MAKSTNKNKKYNVYFSCIKDEYEQTLEDVIDAVDIIDAYTKALDMMKQLNSVDAQSKYHVSHIESM